MWSDKETEKDCLGYSSYVTVLAEVCLHEDLAPLTLGIFGSWGSGKTSLMRMLLKRIEQSGAEGATSGAAATQGKTLWFNAWRYEGRDEAQSALIHAILAKLTEGKTLGQDIADTINKLKEGASVLKLAKFITKTAITLTPDIEGFIDCFKLESEKVAATMESFERDFAKLLEQMQVQRMVVFIDDLDRCSSEKVIETFETIKLFLNIPSCTFVIGADASKIENAVADVYKVGEGVRVPYAKDYLEKIIQIPFTIPEQNIKDITCYVGMLVMGRCLKEPGWEALAAARASFYADEVNMAEAICGWPAGNRLFFRDSVERVVSELHAVIPYTHILGHGLRGNPRQIKRFLNILALRRRLAEVNDLKVQPDMLIKITTLEYVWDKFFNAVVETIDPSTGKSELIGEVISAATEEKKSDSQLVVSALELPGLVEFLTAVPSLTGEEDLRPYLFLAQTSLSRGREIGLIPIEEKARSIVSRIVSEDRLQSKAAAKQAAAQEPTVVAAIVRSLVGSLLAENAGNERVQILTALDTICLPHKEHYPAVIKALEQLNPGTNEAIAITASAFLANAERNIADVPEELKEKYTSASPLAAALAPRRPVGRGR